jgi:hypothetical protein
MQEELSLTPELRILDIPAEMVVEIATGMEEPKDIASRYGFDAAQWEKLSVWKPFLDSVAQQRAVLERDGYTFRIKVRALTEDVFTDAYKIARSNDTTLLQKLEFVKLGAKLGDMEPKQSVQAEVGAGFSITINMGEVAKKARKVDISDGNVQKKPKIKHIASEITDLEPKKESNERPKLHSSRKRKTVPSE